MTLSTGLLEATFLPASGCWAAPVNALIDGGYSLVTPVTATPPAGFTVRLVDRR